MSVGLVLFMSVMYLVLCFMFSKRSKHVITMMVVAPLDVFTMICDVFYDMPYHVFATGRWCGVRVRAHGVEFFAFVVLLTCMGVWGCAVWCGRVCKGMAIGAIGAIRGRRVFTMDNDTYEAIVGGDDDNSGAHDGACVLHKPLEEEGREKMYPRQKAIVA